MTWKLSEVMTALVALEETVHEGLRVYRYRPVSKIQCPCIYNWADPSLAEWKDTILHRDAFMILAVVAVYHTDNVSDMARVEEYADAFREVVTPALDERPPLGGVRLARRRSMEPVVDDFNGVPVLGWGFTLEIWADRLITP